MVLLNRENSIQELEKLNNPCPDKLCFSYDEDPHSITNWSWLYKTNNKIYDCLNMSKLPFIQNERIPYVMRKTNSTEMFEICFSEIPDDIDKIEVALNNTNYRERPMFELREFHIRMYDITDIKDILLWNEFGFKNIPFSDRFLCGSQLLIGTFAKVNDFWRFHPQMLDITGIWNYSVGIL